MTPEFTDELLAISRQFGMAERDAVCCGDVTVQQCMALQLLHEESLAIGALAERMGVTPGATTRLVDGMIGRGWLERRRDPDDRRRVLLKLTEEGRQEAEYLRDSTEEVVEDVLEELPADERETILAALRSLREAMQRAEVHGNLCVAAESRDEETA
jgi:DNA-binding MarR family transcriptional regulator